MTPAAPPLPSLQTFLKDTRHWNNYDLHVVGDIKQLQMDMRQVREAILPHLPMLRRAAVELILRRHTRRIDKALGVLINGYGIDSPLHPRPATQLAYASNLWEVSHQHVLATYGPQAMFGLAYRLRLGVLRERLHYNPSSNALFEIYQALHTHRKSQPDLKEQMPNPLGDALGEIVVQRIPCEYEARTWDELKAISAQLDLPESLETDVFRDVCHTLASDMITARNAPRLVDLMLEHGVEWEPMFDQLDPEAQEHIQQHAVYKRAALLKLAQHHIHEKSPTAVSPRPAF